MPLPPVQGWLIDFRTAKGIFDSGSNARINHCVDLCQNGQLHICPCEEGAFRKLQSLKEHFITNQKCVFELDDDIIVRCAAVGGTPNAKGLIVGNEAAVYLTAIAASKNFGIISDHRSFIFKTVFDLCQTYGIPNFTADEYFAAL